MKVAFVTGGSTGIGRASVLKLVDEGYKVCFLDINETEAQVVLDTVSNKYDIVYVKGSTTEKKDIKKALDVIDAKFGRLDVLFANAGIHQRNNILNITDEEFDRIININIYGTVNTLRAAVPYMIEKKGTSIIINASDQSFIGKANSFAYGLTKGALGQIAKSLSIDLGKYGIRVNAICPGTIHTPLVDNLFNRISNNNKAEFDKLIDDENKLYPRGYMGKAEEVAELVAFLASDKASFMTGGNYLVDGGLVAQ